MACAAMYVIYIYMVHVPHMYHICTTYGICPHIWYMHIYVFMYTHTYINNNIPRKGVLMIWENKEGIREKRLGRNWRQKRERGKRCNYSLN